MQESTDHASEESIAELVHRALIQAGDMQAAEDKLREIAQRSTAMRLESERSRDQRE